MKAEHPLFTCSGAPGSTEKKETKSEFTQMQFDQLRSATADQKNHDWTLERHMPLIDDLNRHRRSLGKVCHELTTRPFDEM